MEVVFDKVCLQVTFCLLSSFLSEVDSDFLRIWKKYVGVELRRNNSVDICETDTVRLSPD